MSKQPLKNVESMLIKDQGPVSRSIVRASHWFKRYQKSIHYYGS